MKKKRTTSKRSILILDKEEELIEQALAAGQLEDDKEFAKTKIMFEEAAAQYLELNKSKPITIRINQLDLVKVKAKAERHQIPYQTLLGTLVHQYAEGERNINL